MIAIGTYTLRRNKSKGKWAIYLKNDEHAMIYVGLYETREAAAAEIKRLEAGEEL